MNYFIIYNECCFYEIVTLNYFMEFTKQEMRFCSLEGNHIKCLEGFRVDSDIRIDEIDVTDANSIILPGGNINNVKSEALTKILQTSKDKGILIGAICAGVNLLDEAGILGKIRSTHTEDNDVVNEDNVITARANAYVDFAIEVAKSLDLFEDEKDLQETIDFWKYHKRM